MKNIILYRKEGYWKEPLQGVADQMHTPIEVHSGADIPADTTFAVRFGCTANVPTKKVLNTARAIHAVYDKSGFRQMVQQNYDDVVPKTWFSPNEIDPASTFRVVLRPEHHSRSKDFFVFHLGQGEYRNLVAKCEQMEPGYYISKFYTKAREFRSHHMGGRIVSVVEKIPADRARLSWGMGSFVNVRWGQWPLGALEKAVQAMSLSELYFSAVDIIQSVNGSYHVLEANSAPELVGGYLQGCFAKGLDWYFDKKPVPKIEGFDSWKNLIHPALYGEV